MFQVFLVGLGGFVGASLRYLCTLGINRVSVLAFPFATLAVNVTGSFLIGFLSQFLSTVCPNNKALSLFLTTGILGGFTTFSTFSLETVNLFQSGKTSIAIVNFFASIFCCFTGVLLGKMLAKAVVH